MQNEHNKGEGNIREGDNMEKKYEEVQRQEKLGKIRDDRKFPNDMEAEDDFEDDEYVCSIWTVYIVGTIKAFCCSSTQPSSFLVKIPINSLLKIHGITLLISF